MILKQMNRRQFLFTGLNAGFAIALHPEFAAAQPRPVTAGISLTSGSAFGTRWHLTLSEGARPEPATEIIRGVVDRVDLSMSPYLADSELSRFNRLPAHTSFCASDALSEVVRTGLSVATRSVGAFDPTVGPIVNRYGFGPIVKADKQSDRTPRHTDIQLHNATLQKGLAGATLDLCGIAKGYTLDVITSLLTENGYDNFLFELGGEVVARGNRPCSELTTAVDRNCQRPWMIGIELPANIGQPWLRTSLANMSIATSGIAHNSYRLPEKQYNHLINPQQETVTDNRLFSVTVLHDSAMLADAWSTALFVAGEDKGPELAREQGLSTLFIKNEITELRYETTGHFRITTG